MTVINCTCFKWCVTFHFFFKFKILIMAKLLMFWNEAPPCNCWMFLYYKGHLELAFMTISSSIISLIQKPYLTLTISTIIHDHFSPLPKSCTHWAHTDQITSITLHDCWMTGEFSFGCIHKTLMALNGVSLMREKFFNN